MRAGQFDRKITIQQRTVTRDAEGGEVEAWSDFLSTWAGTSDYSRKKGNEYFASGKETGLMITQFTIRWHAGITLQMRILHDSLIYDISGITEITRRKGLVIDAHAPNA